MQAPAPCKERKERGTPGNREREGWATRQVWSARSAVPPRLKRAFCNRPNFAALKGRASTVVQTVLPDGRFRIPNSQPPYRVLSSIPWIILGSETCHASAVADGFAVK